MPGQLTIEQAYQLRVLHARPDLDTDRVADATEVFDMRAIELPRPVPDPQKVCRSVVERRRSGSLAWLAGAGQRELTRHGLFVVEHEAFVTIESLAGSEQGHGTGCRHLV